MTGQLRAAIVRHRRSIAAIVLGGVAWCVAVEIWLPRQDPLSAGRPDIVIALSSSVQDDGEIDEVATARLRTAIAVAKGTNATLVTTRVANEDNPLLLSDGPQRRLITEAGLAKRWMILDGVALTTRDEAERFRKVFEPTRIALVTSRLHTRRACRTFETLGFQVTCISSGLDGAWWRIPWSVAYETAAWIKYQLEGWI